MCLYSASSSRMVNLGRKQRVDIHVSFRRYLKEMKKHNYVHYTTYFAYHHINRLRCFSRVRYARFYNKRLIKMSYPKSPTWSFGEIWNWRRNRKPSDATETGVHCAPPAPGSLLKSTIRVGATFPSSPIIVKNSGSTNCTNCSRPRGENPDAWCTTKDLMMKYFENMKFQVSSYFMITTSSTRATWNQTIFEPGLIQYSDFLWTGWQTRIFFFNVTFEQL